MLYLLVYSFVSAWCPKECTDTLIIGISAVLYRCVTLLWCAKLHSALIHSRLVLFSDRVCLNCGNRRRSRHESRDKVFLHCCVVLQRCCLVSAVVKAQKLLSNRRKLCRHFSRTAELSSWWGQRVNRDTKERLKLWHWQVRKHQNFFQINENFVAISAELQNFLHWGSGHHTSNAYNFRKLRKLLWPVLQICRRKPVLVASLCYSNKLEAHQMLSLNTKCSARTTAQRNALNTYHHVTLIASLSDCWILMKNNCLCNT